MCHKVQQWKWRLAEKEDDFEGIIEDKKKPRISPGLYSTFQKCHGTLPEGNAGLVYVPVIAPFVRKSSES